VRLVILTLQISPYHNIRYESAARQLGEVNVISTQNTGDFEQFVATNLGGYRVYKLCNGRAEYSRATASGELASKVRAALGAIMPEAIAVAGWAAPESISALIYARELGVPTIVMSESQRDDAPRSIIREQIKKRVVSQFDAALVGGDTHAEYISRLGIPNKCIHLGYNVVDNEHFARGARVARAIEGELRTRLGLPARYVLASSRFVPKKNLVGLVEGYAMSRNMVDLVPDLVILGDGPERTAISTAVSRLGLSGSVHLPGFIAYDGLPAYYGLSEGFVHVSTVEQWGLVINEAMAAALPVVASRRCGAARTLLKHGESGFLTDPDPTSIAHSLATLFRLSHSSRIAIGSCAASAISQWGPDRFGAGLKAAAESAAAVRRRGPISAWDRTILRHLQGRLIEHVG